MGVSSALSLLAALAILVQAAHCATVRSFPKYDYGGKDHSQFIQDALARSTPGSARLLAELFGGLQLDMDFEGRQAIITVGGAATRCQHQSPCYDANCKACYDPLLRIHGKCGGASYFTCRGSLPKPCLPYTCTYRGETSRTGKSINDEAVFVKKFSRFEDIFCIAEDRSFNEENSTAVNSVGELEISDEPEWVMPVSDAVTQCKGYDTCVHMSCGSCYDPYLGAHTTCGKMSYFDCDVSLPDVCRPMKCTDSIISDIFPMNGSVAEPRSVDAEEFMHPTVKQILVRNFTPLPEERKKCKK